MGDTLSLQDIGKAGAIQAVNSLSASVKTARESSDGESFGNILLKTADRNTSDEPVKTKNGNPEIKRDQKTVEREMGGEQEKGDVRSRTPLKSEVKDAGPEGNRIPDEKAEAVKDAVETIMEEVKEELGVSDEDIINAMEVLGLTVTDILKPENIGILTAELKGIDISEVVTDEEIFGNVQDILNLQKEVNTDLMQKLDMTSAEFREVLDMPEMKEAVESVSDLKIAKDPGPDFVKVLEPAANEMGITSDTVKEVTPEKTASDPGTVFRTVETGTEETGTKVQETGVEAAEEVKAAPVTEVKETAPAEKASAEKAVTETVPAENEPAVKGREVTVKAASETVETADKGKTEDAETAGTVRSAGTEKTEETEETEEPAVTVKTVVREEKEVTEKGTLEKEAITSEEETAGTPAETVKSSENVRKTDGQPERSVSEVTAEKVPEDGKIREIPTEQGRNREQGESRGSFNRQMNPGAQQPVFISPESQTVDFADELTGAASETTSEFINSYERVRDIMNQVRDQIRIQISEETTTMEMQLNPESLGKVGLHIESKAGNVTAQFFAQDETVRAALESQVAELKRNLEEQGIKVESVEVTIASREFESNFLNQGERRNDGTPDREETERAARLRRINLGAPGAGDIPEGLSEEEELNRRIMAENGGTVDFTA